MIKDYVIKDDMFGTYYYYYDDFEYGGWQTGALNDADGFDTEDEALETITREQIHGHVCERICTVREL